MENVIEMENVGKTYKVLKRKEGLRGAVQDIFSHNYQYIKAVDQITLSLKKGEILGFLGPNGSGKSTTIKMMTGILKPTEGKVRVDGLLPWKERIELTKRIGVVFGQRTQLWWSLPFIESLKVLKKIYRISEKDYQANLKLFQSIVDIESLFLKPVRQMSLGQRTLCDIVASFLHNPSIVFLDEPTIGLDVIVKENIRMLIKSLNKEKGTSVLVTTHDMKDVEELCENVAVLDKGKIIFHNSLDSIYRTYKNTVCLFVLTDFSYLSNGEISRIVEEFKQEDIYITDIDYNRNSFAAHTDNYNLFDYQLNSITKMLAEKFPIYHIKIMDTDLESLIKKIYRGEQE